MRYPVLLIYLNCRKEATKKKFLIIFFKHGFYKLYINNEIAQ